MLQAWHHAILTGTPYEQEVRLLTADGQYRWFLCRGVPLCDGSGNAIRWFESNTDIDQQKKAEEELRAADQQLQRQRDRLRLLLDLSHQFITKLDLDEFLNAVLDGLCRLAGWEWGSVLLAEPPSDYLRAYRSRGTDLFPEGTMVPIEGTISGQVYRSKAPLLFRGQAFPPRVREYPWMREAVRANNSACALPLIYEEKVLGVLLLMARGQRTKNPAIWTSLRNWRSWWLQL